MKPVAPRCARHESDKTHEYSGSCDQEPLVFAGLARFVRPAKGRWATGLVFAMD
jgi:hypothetical protein